MNIKPFLLATFLTFSGISLAQNKEVLFTVDGKPYYTDEFIRVYNKNLDLVKDESQKDLNNYLDLFISYKLKVNKAQKLALDKESKYINELKSYRTQLSKDYLTDTEVTEQLVQEAYNRMLKEIKASHILFLVDENASPKDTLKAYQKAISTRERILKGEDFGKLAQELSEDPSAKDNKGDLGYFSVFRMVYPFESGAYNTKKGEVSKPVRSRFGYHIIKVDDIRENRGEVTVAHIMVTKSEADAKNKEALEKINTIYQKLQQGEKFEELVMQFSEDKTSAEKGGKLARFSSGQLNSVAFENAAFGIKNAGEYTQPVETEFGYHIIKLIEKHPVKTYEQLKTDLENRIKRDERSKRISDSFNHKLESKYKPVVDEKLLKKALDLITENYYKDDFKLPENTTAFNKPIYTIQSKVYTGVDFLNYIQTQQHRVNKIEPLERLKQTIVENFKTSNLNEYHDGNLENEFAEFRYIMEEYKEGLLLFDLMEKEIWQRAHTDTVGLEAFYQKNKNNYKWNERLSAVVASSVNREHVEKTKKYFEKNKSIEYIKKQLNKNAVVNIMMDEGLFEQNSNGLPKEYKLAKGVSEIYKQGDYYYVILGKEITPSTVKTLEEAKGRVISDYQQYLEETWIDELKKEFSYQVDNNVFDKVKNQLQK